MSNKCDICGKATKSGNNVSHSNKKTKRTFKPNLQTVRTDDNGSTKRRKICTRCLRSNKITKVG